MWGEREELDNYKTTTRTRPEQNTETCAKVPGGGHWEQTQGYVQPQQNQEHKPKQPRQAETNDIGGWVDGPSSTLKDRGNFLGQQHWR